MTGLFDGVVDSAKAVNRAVSDVVAEVAIGLADYLAVPAVQVVLGILYEAERRNRAEAEEGK